MKFALKRPSKNDKFWGSFCLNYKIIDYSGPISTAPYKHQLEKLDFDRGPYKHHLQNGQFYVFLLENFGSFSPFFQK